MWRCEYLSRLYKLRLDLLNWEYLPHVAVSHKCFKGLFSAFYKASNLKSLKCFNISVSLCNNFPFLETNFPEACWLDTLASIS